jgi:outer membrane protein OmpA-like peptidoglycan-associated protein/tetratricopeptide (TPR) repeat protein
MRTISIITLSLGLLLLVGCKQGQISRGDAAYENMAYKKAIKHYEKALGGKENPRLHAKIAKAYDKMNNTAKAEEHYAMALKDENAGPDIKLGYAKSLLANGKQEEGLEVMNQYKEMNPNDVNAAEWAAKHTKIGEYGEFDPNRVKVEAIPLKDFSATFAAYPVNDYIYFVGEKDVKAGDVANPWNGKSFLDVYQVQQVTGTEWNEPKAAKGMNTILHDGPLTLDPGGEYAFVTRSAVDDKNKRKLDSDRVNQLKISEFIKATDQEWKFSKDLPFNQANSSTMHPSMTADGRTLFFSSDRKGGKGEADIYMVSFDGNNWGEPQNLGPEINTGGNEVFPFAKHKDTLFFSSDGHGGMGGLDIFITIFDGNSWSHPRNLKAPINTNFDDFSFYRNAEGMSGYFSSNRSGRDQIYTWDVTDPQFIVVGRVVDVDNDPVSNANIVLRDGNTPVDSVKSGQGGDFSMPLDWNKDYELSGKNKTQLTDTVKLSTVGLAQSDTFTVELKLEGPEFWVLGYVVDKNSRQRLPDVNVELLNAADARLNQVKSDANGDFKFRLNRNEDYSIYGNKKNNFTRKAEVSTMGLKESKTFEVVLELEEVKEQTTIVLNNIYYDYNKWNIRKDAVGDLDNLLRFLKDNPSVRIEMSSHTDSRGTDSYNLGLSDKRAKSAMEYLISRGIDAGRMEYKGYGESKLVNECKDGVPCSEEKHQQNRRTEFTVLKID